MTGSTEPSRIRRNTLLYTGGSLIYFFAQWLMTVIIVKTSGFMPAGLLSLAMNVTSAPAIAALFNVRNYQISDLKGEFSDRTYIMSRVYTCLLGVVLCLVISLVNRYDGTKIAAIMTYMLFKAVESFADVYIGIEQKNGRLDLAGISLLIRGIGVIAAFYIVIRLTDNLTAANLAVAAVSAVVVALIDRRFSAGVCRKEGRDPGRPGKDCFRLLWICLPLAAVAFLNNYSYVIPKLILEAKHGQEILGVYNSVSSPTLVIPLVASTVFAPWVPGLTGHYIGGDKSGFNRAAVRILAIFLVLTILCLGAVYLLNLSGILENLLVFLYAEEIRAYTGWFLPVCVSAVLIALNTCLFSVCTLMRMIRSQCITAAAGVIAAYGFSYLLIPGQGIRGTVGALIAATAVQILVQSVIVAYGYRRFPGTR